MAAKRVVWEATEKQSEFLSCSDYEVLYGGAVGGGKSDALLIDLWCLQNGGPSNPNHRAICFRRTFPELKDLISRSIDLFPQFIPGATYNKVDHIWTTPAGAKFEFGHLNNDNDRFKYRGRAWNAIGFDELTLWATNVCYNYLRTRNRTTDSTLPRVIRATTNPDGVGQKWVMERWGIEESGTASRIVVPMMFEESDGKGGFIEVERHMARTFIPAKLADNPFLRGTGYRETLMDMPQEERDALLNGLWTGNRVEGAYYFKELQKARAEGRVGRVHHQPGEPVNTFWDLGWNDSTSIWCHQGIRLENRFLRSYQNSGETLAHYAGYLQQMALEHGYVYGTHYLPHDGINATRQTGKTDLQILREAMPGQNFVIVPRIEKVITGINQTRAAFPSCYFDEKECGDGLAALALYRKKFNNAIGAYSDEAVHDTNSNYADAFRQFAQGFDGARIHLRSSAPEWHKKVKQLSHTRRNPATA